MSSDLRDGLSFGKQIVAGIQEKNVPFMAASIAYQAFLSLLPLLVLVFFLVTIVGDETFAQQVTATTEDFLPESGQLLIEESIENSPATAGSTIIGVVVLVWGSLKIFRGLDKAFSEIYDASSEGSFVETVRDALLVFGAVGGALFVAAGLGIAFAFLPSVPGLGLVQSLLLVCLLALAFYPMYYYFPNVDTSRREVIPGVVLAAVGWTALQSLFRVYVGLAADEGGGVLGGIILLLTWLYFGGLILLSGAVVNAIGTGYLEPASTAENEAGSDEKSPTNGYGTSIPESDRDPFLDDRRRQRARLTDRVETLERERDQFRNDLKAQRRRRYRLEDRVDDLERTARDLESENERLRDELERRRRQEPPWRRTLRAALTRVDHVNIGVIKRE
ncbi:YihY/virulence factor BrkB family protein [Halobiforma nitratireducens]|uniref:Ribonuclease BN n=1 Tax=Halobiforma nitratireducens JCM 10879 TaxID=1227454 RepID=M0MQT1_9EURY|nr:YihY/virulence factor BrkB family protein [Halobiforma nitratireducens]EMA46835.1 ribonuclease BN [Halobiforma nitratireducens JCM 10879]